MFKVNSREKDSHNPQIAHINANVLPMLMTKLMTFGLTAAPVLSPNSSWWCSGTPVDNIPTQYPNGNRLPLVQAAAPQLQGW